MSAPTPSPEQVLACPMQDNDANAATVRDYLLALVRVAWEEKRPFGNSGWHHDLYFALAEAGLLPATKQFYDTEDSGDYDWNYDDRDAEALVLAAIGSLR